MKSNNILGRRYQKKSSKEWTPEKEGMEHKGQKVVRFPNWLDSQLGLEYPFATLWSEVANGRRSGKSEATVEWL